MPHDPSNSGRVDKLFALNRMSHISIKCSLCSVQKATSGDDWPSFLQKFPGGAQTPYSGRVNEFSLLYESQNPKILIVYEISTRPIIMNCLAL